MFAFGPVCDVSLNPFARTLGKVDETGNKKHSICRKDFAEIRFTKDAGCHRHLIKLVEKLLVMKKWESSQ